MTFARFVECPQCGADISDSYQEDDFDVGIVGGYYCEKCSLGVPEEHDDEEMKDASLSS
jgi:hypothetical protein